MGTLGILTMEKYERRKIGSVGSSRIRGDWLIKNWRSGERLMDAEEFIIGKKYDAVIYQKAYFKEHMAQAKCLKIFDLCDPDWLDSRPVQEVASYVDAFVVPTENLKKALADFIDKPIIVIPDRMDLEFYKNPKLKHEGTAKSCVYFGYSNNANLVLPQCIETLKYHNLKLTVIADAPFVSSGFYETSFVKYDNATVNEEIKKHDFVLLPQLEDDYRFSMKSNNKTVSSWLNGMPVAHTPEDVARFMNGEERAKESAKNYKIACEKYDVRLSVEEYDQLISLLLAGN